MPDALQTAQYLRQCDVWPAQGRHIMAQYDVDSVVVYQAFRPAIADWAVARQRFGGPFSFTRMSWIKPNFLWMMYRCGWATKENQERVLSVRITREGFDSLLADAVHSNYVDVLYGTREQWQARVQASDVRLQWDPDHAPDGSKLERRAIQLGLRGAALRHYATDWIVAIEDVTGFVDEQRQHLDDLAQLCVPFETSYPAPTPEIAAHLGLATATPET